MGGPERRRCVVTLDDPHTRHRIQAWPEGRADNWLLTNEEAENLLDRWFTDHEYCHNMTPAGPLVLGADWVRSDFAQFTEEGHTETEVWQWAVTTAPGGNFAGHHLTRVEGRAVYLFDIGPVTANDIDPIDPTGRPSPFSEFHQ